LLRRFPRVIRVHRRPQSRRSVAWCRCENRGRREESSPTRRWSNYGPERSRSQQPHHTVSREILRIRMVFR